MRLVGVHDQRERPPAGAGLQGLHGRVEHRRRKRPPLGPGVVGVRDVAAHALGQPRPLDRGVQPALERGGRDRAVAASDLTAVPDEQIEAAPQRLVRGGEAQKRVVGHVAGPPAGSPQDGREGGVEVLQRLPARLGQQAGVVAPVAKRKRAPAGQDRVAHRNRRHALGEHAVEGHALGRKSIDVRRRGPRPERVVGAQAVDHDEHDVRPIRRRASFVAAEVERGSGRRSAGQELAPRPRHRTIVSARYCAPPP